MTSHHEEELAAPDAFELNDYDESTKKAAIEGYRDSVSFDDAKDNASDLSHTDTLLHQKEPNGSYKDDVDRRGGHMRGDSTAAVFAEDPFLGMPKKKSRKRWLIPLMGTVVLIALLGAVQWYQGKVPSLPVVLGGIPHMQQTPNPRGNQRALILASYPDQNITWMEEIPKAWDVWRYYSDVGNSNQQQRKRPPPKHRFDGIPVVKAKVGREAMPYLTYITDNWDDLPPIMVFMHGHDTGWHQPEHAIEKLRALNLAALEKEGWLSIRCSTFILCGQYGPHNLSAGVENMGHGGGPFEATRALPAWWVWLFGEDPDVKEDMPPDHFGGQGGGQFAVTRERLQQRPLIFYRRLLRALTHDLDEIDRDLREISARIWNIPAGQRGDDMFKPINEYMLGILFEKTWHRMFGKPDHFCPDQDMCRKDWYSGAINCTLLFPDAPGQAFHAYFQGNCTVDQAAMDKAMDMNAKFLEPQ